MNSLAFSLAGWGRLALAEMVIRASERAVIKKIDGATSFLMKPFENFTRLKAEATIVCGEKEVCGALMHNLARRAYACPEALGKEIYFVGGLTPWTGYYANRFIPRQTKAGITPPGFKEIESDYMKRVFIEEYRKAGEECGRVRDANKDFHLVTASSVGKRDEGSHLQANMTLADELGASAHSNLAITTLPYGAYRAIGTMMKRRAEVQPGVECHFSPYLLFPDAIGITAKTWKAMPDIRYLVVGEMKLAGPDGKYTGKFFTPFEPERLSKANKAFASRYPEKALG